MLPVCGDEGINPQQTICNRHAIHYISERAVTIFENFDLNADVLVAVLNKYGVDVPCLSSRTKLSLRPNKLARL